MPARVAKAIIAVTDRVFGRFLDDKAVIAEGYDVSAVAPWSSVLSENLDAIRAEAETVLDRFDVLPTLGESSDVGPGPNKDINWKIYPFRLMYRHVGSAVPTPVLRSSLERIPYTVNAFLSILPPHTRLAPHYGTAKALARCHLGLRIPTDSENCYFVVDNHRHVWQQGKMLLFDQTYEHYAANDTDEYRILLILDVVRGDLARPLRWLVSGISFLLGFHPETRLPLRNYRRAFRVLPEKIGANDYNTQETAATL